MISEGYGNKCEVCPAPRYVYYTKCGCYSKGDCNCSPGYYCCPVTCGNGEHVSFEGYSCRKPIQGTSKLKNDKYLNIRTKKDLSST